MRHTSAKSYQIDWELLAGLRFVLAGIVLCGHIDLYFSDPYGILHLIGDFGAKASVIGFFIVSGYSIAASLQRNPQDYHKRRFLRIYPVYLFAIAATLLLENALHGQLAMPNGDHLTALSPLAGLANAFFLQTFVVKPLVFDGAVWSLAIEVSYYLVAPLLPRLPKWTPLAIIAVSALSYSLPRHNDWGAVYYLFTRFNMLEWAWPWFMGYFLFFNSRPLVLLGFAALGAALMGTNMLFNPEPLSVVTFLACLALIVVAERGRPLRQIAPGLARALGWLGNVSYPLYLVQFPIFLGAWGLFGISNPAWLITLCLAGSIATYYAVDVYLKRRLVAMIEELGPRLA